MQRAPAPYVRTAAPLKEAVVSPPLPPLQSVAEAPAWQEALLASMAVASPPTAAGGAMTASPLGEIATGGAATTAAPLFSQQAFAAAAEAAPASGVRADGTRWWSESGTEEREAGRRVTWTAIKCVSPDGATEWQEKWWSASDKFAYKEMGAEKSGRASDGRVWREAWTEVYAPDPMTGLGHIVRSADKWATGSDGSKWHEAWDEQHWADGGTLRSADKWGRVAPGVIPEDGHASEWRERWGEAWDGKGGASKWADKTASRDEREGGGASRRWGDKWTQEFRAGVGGRWGESWSDDPEGGGWCVWEWGTGGSLSQSEFGFWLTRFWCPQVLPQVGGGPLRRRLRPGAQVGGGDGRRAVGGCAARGDLVRGQTQLRVGGGHPPLAAAHGRAAEARLNSLLYESGSDCHVGARWASQTQLHSMLVITMCVTIFLLDMEYDCGLRPSACFPSWCAAPQI